MKLNLNHLLVGLLIIFSVSGCNFEDKTDETDRVKQEDMLKIYIDTLKTQINTLHLTNSGLYYIIENKGDTNDLDTLKTNDYARLYFAGYVLKKDDITKKLYLTLVETNIDSVAKKYNIKSATAFQFPIWWQMTKVKLIGLKQGIVIMNKSAKYRFIIPYSLALGSGRSSDGIAEPYATFIYDIELVEKIKNPKQQDSLLFENIISTHKNDTTQGDTIFNKCCINHSILSKDTIKSGNKIKLQYRIRWMDGTYLYNDTTYRDSTITVGSKAIIPGGGLDYALTNKKYKLEIIHLSEFLYPTKALLVKMEYQIRAIKCLYHPILQ